MRAKPASLAILGAYPPPYGGVTVHTRRLCALLDERGIDYVVYNAVSAASDGRRIISVARGRRRWMLRYLLWGREPAVYLMSLHLSAWLVGALLVTLRGKRVYLRLQSEHLKDWCRSSRWRRGLARFALRRMTGIIAVNRELVDLVRSLGVPAERIHWFPGYLPPTPDEHERTGVAPAVWAFAEGHKPLLVANGKICRHHGEDLYGLDHLVELAARLAPDYPTLVIAICFWEHRAEEEAALAELRERAAELGVADRMLFHTTPGLLLPVIAAADLFLRPTNTDGDANSIREALDLGIPTIASDAVERPEGTVLFRTRDLDDFESCARAHLGGARRPAPGQNSIARERVTRYLELITALAQEDRPAH